MKRCYKCLILILGFIFLSVDMFADTFVVTSNADSGPGTLRDAMTQANTSRTTTLFYINFNIADQSEAGRTITLKSALPLLTHSIIIDGSTQPGNTLGVSQAKIKLLVSYHDNAGTSALAGTFVQGVEIYGLLIDQDPQFFTINGAASSGISFQGAQIIIIGAPGKGNVIKNFKNNIQISSNNAWCFNIKVSSNFIGVNEDGVSACALDTGSTTFDGIAGFTFGGNTAAEGNVCFGSNTYEDTQYDPTISKSDLLVSNNTFGLNYQGTAALTNTKPQGSDFTINDPNPSLSSCKILNNLSIGEFFLTVTECFFNFQGNKIGTDVTGQNIITHKSMGLLMANCTGGGIVGGQNPGEGNIFAGCGGPGYLPDSIPVPFCCFPPDVLTATIINNQCSAVEVVGNVIECNNGLLPYQIEQLDKNGAGESFGGVSSNSAIVARTTNSVSGTSPPNSRVDLYYSIKCSFCEPEKMFASVQSDARGNWIYNGPLDPYNITINATTNGNSNVFTTLRFAKAGTVKMACDGSNGAITGMITYNATNFQWFDDNNNPVGTPNTVDLVNVPVGKYHMVINNGTTCSLTSGAYIVNDLANQIDSTARVITPDLCNSGTGSITGLKVTLSSTVTWTDATGNVVGNKEDLLNIKAGTYRLTAANGGCTQIYGPVTIPNSNAGATLQIASADAKITDDGCSAKTGSIMGIQVTGGLAPYKYSWADPTGNIVGSSADLSNIGAGSYTITVTDGRSCDMPATATYTVQNQDNDINPPQINNVQICFPGTAVIAVNNPSVAFTYNLYDSKTAIAPIAQQTNGRFSINVKKNSTFYVSQLLGNCESGRTPVTVLVDLNAAEIPNAITPNADGINDYWNIPGIEAFPQAMVRIYNRSGQLIFESRGYATPFDGTYNGKPLPFGTYYYIIEVSGNCNQLSGSLTIVR